jgi:hypothetical protein
MERLDDPFLRVHRVEEPQLCACFAPGRKSRHGPWMVSGAGGSDRSEG